MRILFVCTGNSYRSPLAEALTRKYHPDLEVESAGTEAVGHISDVTEDQLEDRDALKFVKPSPNQITQRALDESDKIVCMMPCHRDFIERNFEAETGKINVWNVEDPIRPDVDAENSFEKIEEKARNAKW